MATPGIIEIVDVKKQYSVENETLQVLGGVSLSIQPGEFLSVVGVSGCGKSTLLRLIIGLDQDYEGEIRVGGAVVRGTSLDRGIVFQDHRLFPWLTVEENIELALLNRALPPARKRQLVREHIELVNLKGFEKAYPHQLSGGMAQRAAIARALVNEPKVLLLDEPLGALDALTRVYLQNELQRIWLQHRSTVIMVTHDVEEAIYLGDRVVVMAAHPGHIARVVAVPLPHPRDRSAPVLRRLKEEILGELMQSPVEEHLLDEAELARKAPPRGQFVW